MSKMFKSPWLEVNVMLLVLILSYVALALITGNAETAPGAMSGGAIWGWLFGFFFLSFAIAMVAVIGGIGGGSTSQCGSRAAARSPRVTGARDGDCGAQAQGANHFFARTCQVHRR